MQAEDGIRDLVRSRGLGDVYKRQGLHWFNFDHFWDFEPALTGCHPGRRDKHCLLYTSDAADERSSVDLGGRRIIKKKTTQQSAGQTAYRKLMRDSINTPDRLMKCKDTVKMGQKRSIIHK